MVVNIRGILILFFISASLHDAIADDTLSNRNPDEGIEDIDDDIEAIGIDAFGIDAIGIDATGIELSGIDVIADDTLSNRNPAVIEDIEVEILEPNPESIKIDEVEGQFIDDNQAKINYEFDREV